MIIREGHEIALTSPLPLAGGEKQFGLLQRW
jgi:hypothetical protein